MNFSQAFKMAAKSISANKGRSALTMLGVIIGLAAVIILVSYAQGQNMALRAYYESMGTNTISVSAYSYRGNVDVASALVNDAGNLPPEGTTDGIHFTRSWYEKWYAYLKTHTVDPAEYAAGQPVAETEKMSE